MKRVLIDRKNGVVVMNGRKIPRLLLGIMRGGVGKRFVVKHYKGGRVVVTKYPDMSGVVPSVKQKERRELFREAVVYAQWIISGEERKKAFRKTLPRKKRRHVYQAAIRMYMSMQGDPRWLRKQLAVKAMTRMEHGDVLVRRMKCKMPNVQTEGKIESIICNYVGYGEVNRGVGQTESVFVKCSNAVW